MMEPNGCFNSGLDDGASKLYEDSESCAYKKCNGIISEHEASNNADQTMPEFDYNGDNNTMNANGLTDGYEAHYYMDYVLKQFEKDMEDRIETEFEEHKGRVFEILSNYKENLNFALEDNMSAVISSTPMMSDSQEKFTTHLLGQGPLPTEAEFQNGSYSSEQTIMDGYLGGGGEEDIEHAVDKLLLEIASNCFQIYRQLDNNQLTS